MKRNTLISIIALLLSVTSVCISCVRCGNTIEIDLVGVLAGILALPVAVLAIFQAINYFVFEKKIEKILDSKLKIIDNKLETTTESLSHASRAYFIYTHLVDPLVTTYNGAFIGCLEGLLEDEKSTQRYATESLMTELVRIIGLMSAHDKKVNKLKKYEYMALISRSNHKDANLILQTINECQEVDS